MNKPIAQLYKRARASGMNAKHALSTAKAITEFNDLESAGLARLCAEPEQESYFSVFGEPDTESEREQIAAALDRDGCYVVYTEIFFNDAWRHADSVGMCVYSNPLDPFENWYVPDLMHAAVALRAKLDADLCAAV